MGNSKIYTLGYSGRTLADIQRIVGRGVLLDIRISPKSRKPGFSEKRLREAFGDNYEWLYEFANEAAADGGIKLYDPAPGLAIIAELVKTGKPLYLMCLCADYDKCHRREVAELLREHGYEVSEYGD